MNSDLSQSILDLDVEVDADILLGVHQRGFGIGGRFAEIWGAPIWGELDARVGVARPGDVLTESDGSQSTMIRLRLNYVF